MDAHVHQALTERHDMLLYDAEPSVASAEEYLLTRYSVRHVEATVVYRRRVEVGGASLARRRPLGTDVSQSLSQPVLGVRSLESTVVALV
jgi:hypothetical protein